MKILIAGAELVKKNDRYMDEMSWSFMKAFERAGAETDYFSYKLEGRFRVIEKDKQLKKLWHFMMNKNLARHVKRTKPDMLVIVKGSTIEADTLCEIRESTGTVIINIMNDNPLLMGNFAAIAPCHYYFVKDTYVVRSLENVGLKNIRYLPQAADATVRDQVVLDDRDAATFSSSVMLMGSMYSYRLKLVEELIHFRPAIWGPGWGRVKNPMILELYKNGEVWGINKTKAICGAEISLNPHHPLNDINGTQSRTFDIALCGGFQLAEYKEDIADLFRIGEEIVCYRNIDELKKLLEYYLSHPDEREKIAQAGRKRAVKDHTYDNRVREILSIVNK